MTKYFSFILSLIFLCGCTTVYNPATGRNEFILIDTKSEVLLGKSLSQQIAKEFKISDDVQLNSRLKMIGEKIAKVSDRQDLEYHFFVVEDKEMNAFAVPGGSVYVNSGILKVANDDELAAVVSHEVGHIAARHSVKKLQAVLGYQLVMNIAFSKASSVDVSQALDVVFNVVSLGYSREDERLADRLAIKYAHKAGFNPRGMITLLYKLEEEAKKQGATYHLIFLSSHPSLEERIKNMDQEIYNLEHPSMKQLDNPAANQKPQLKSGFFKAEVGNNNKIATNNVGSSSFQESKTRKICPICKTAYPSSYNFCPKDAAKLLF